MTTINQYPNSKIVDDNTDGTLNIVWTAGMTRSNDTKDYKGATPQKLLMSANFITADLTFFEYDVNDLVCAVIGTDGNAYTITGAAASSSYPLDQNVFAGIRKFYVVASAAQTSGTTITMALAPMWG